MVPTLPKQSANPVVPTLPVVQANVALLGVAATIDAVRGSNSATPLWIPTLPAVQVNEPLLSRSRPTYDGIAAPADYADLVMVANLQLVAGSEHPWTEMDWTKISAFDRLGLDPNIDMSEEEDLNAQMEAAMALLQ